METIILVGAVAVWGAVHSWLASASVKGLFGRNLGQRAMRAYRLGYNAFAALSFLPILILVRALPDHVIYLVKAPWLFLMLAGQALATLCALLVLLQTDTLHFIGVRQLVEGEKPPRLVATGFYQMVRHPLYLFGLAILWLTPIMTVNLLTVFVLLTVYIFVGATFEEHRLQREFGAAYAEYRSHTPMIIPGVKFGLGKMRRGGA